MKREELINRLNKSKHFEAEEIEYFGSKSIILTAKNGCYSQHFEHWQSSLTDRFSKWLNDKGWHVDDCPYEACFYLVNFDI